MDWTAVGSGATAAAVLIAAVQVRFGSKAARTGFEDALAKEYREIASRIPVSAHLADELPSGVQEEAMQALFQYFDLCNQQVFLRVAGRISKLRWLEWCEGIKANLEKPAFRAAWQQVTTQAPEVFNELRRLAAEDFRVDPRDWLSRSKRVSTWWAA